MWKWDHGSHLTGCSEDRTGLCCKGFSHSACPIPVALPDSLPIQSYGHSSATSPSTTVLSLSIHFFSAKEGFIQNPSSTVKKWWGDMINKKIKAYVPCLQGLPGGASGKELICQCKRHKRCGFKPWVWKIPWRRKWQPTLVLLPGESHGQKRLVGYSP